MASTSNVKISAETLRAVRRHGPSVDKLARKQYNISGEALLAKLVKGESNDNPKAVSSAGARGRTQFIRTSRDAVRKRYGVDPWSGKADDEVKAAVLHLTGKLGHRKGLEGYNPGDATNYTKYILAQKVGDVRGKGARPAKGKPAARQASRPASPQQDGPDVEAAALDALAARATGKRKGSLLRATVDRLQSGAYDPEPEVKPNKPTTAKPGKQVEDIDQTEAVAPTGKVKFAPGADRPGVPTQKVVKSFLSSMSRYAGTINVGTGTQHSKMSASGNVSGHWVGTAADIPARGKRGDDIAYAAFRAAGVDAKTARRYASNGGLYNIQYKGKRVQIIWKTNTGGNHYDHVHVGIK